MYVPTTVVLAGVKVPEAFQLRPIAPPIVEWAEPVSDVMVHAIGIT